MGKSKSLTFLTQKPMSASSYADRLAIISFVKSGCIVLTANTPNKVKCMFDSCCSCYLRVSQKRRMPRNESKRPQMSARPFPFRGYSVRKIAGEERPDDACSTHATPAILKVGPEGRNAHAWWKDRKRLSEGPQISEQTAFPSIFNGGGSLVRALPCRL